VEATRALEGAIASSAFAGPVAGWLLRPLGEISSIAGGIQKSPSRAPLEHHRPFLTVRNVQRGYLDLSVVERFEVTPLELTRLRLQHEDLLIVEGNGSLDHIGRNALFRADGQEWIHQNHVIRVRLDRNHALPEFVSRFLNSEAGRQQMIEKARTSSGLYTLSAGKVAHLEIPVPPMVVQLDVVARLDSASANANAALEAAESELKQIRALPAALRRRAFAER
jgi:type I restriction enzyme S subunit